MPQHSETRLLPYSPGQLYGLVKDVAAYPSFLPWCLNAKIHSQTDTEILADLTVGKGFLKDTFTSKVRLTPNQAIEVFYENGPLKYLHNEWRFTPTSDTEGSKTLVHFSIDFAFHASALNGLMSAFFQQAFTTMIQAFEKEAKKRYG